MTTPPVVAHLDLAACAGPDLASLERTDLVCGDAIRITYPVLAPAHLASIVESLTSTREIILGYPVARLVSTLGRVGERFLDQHDVMRTRALELLPPTTGLSMEMTAEVLDGMARDWTAERLDRLVRAELDDPGVLDGFVTVRGRRVMAFGPCLSVQMVAGSVPGVGTTALLRSLLVKSPTLLKPGRGDVVLPVLFARALAEEDEALARALAVVYWPGGDARLEEAAFANAEAVTAYGSDETVEAVRARVPTTSRLVTYHHRVSLGAIGPGALNEERARRTAAHVAQAVAMFDQRGCVSPQILYLVEGGETSPEEFADLVGRELGRLESELPGGVLDVDEAAALQQLRGTAELMEGSGRARLRHGGREASWTVVVERDGTSAISCVGRCARIRPVRDVAEIPALLEPLRRHLQSMALDGFEGPTMRELRGACAERGVTRFTTFARLAFPPPWWLHDGRGPLTELVRWVEAEAT